MHVIKDVPGHTNLNTKRVYLNIDFNTLLNFALEVSYENNYWFYFSGCIQFINTPFIYPAIFRLLYACETKVGETLSLKTDDVNLEEDIITLYNWKNKVSRMIPMSNPLTKYLRMEIL